jgi:hypothetical protein
VDQLGAECVEGLMAVREVTTPDAHAALWFETELRPCIEAWPQQQLERDRSRVPRAAQRSGHAPRVGSAALWSLEEEAAVDRDAFVAGALSPPFWEVVEQAARNAIIRLNVLANLAMCTDASNGRSERADGGIA